MTPRRIWVEKYELTTYRYDDTPADYAAEDKPFDTLAEDTAYEDYPPPTLHQFKAISTVSYTPFEVDSFGDSHERSLVTDLIPPADLVAYAPAGDIARRAWAFWVLRKRRNEKEAKKSHPPPTDIDAIWSHALVACDKLSDTLSDLPDTGSAYRVYMKALDAAKERQTSVRAARNRTSGSLSLDLAYQLLADFEKDLVELPKLAATPISFNGDAKVRLQATEGDFVRGTLMHLVSGDGMFDDSDPIEYIIDEVKYMASPTTAIRTSDDTCWLLPHTASHITYWST